MRDRYLAGYDAIWIDSLNGDKYRTGKLTPAGESDPSAFSTDTNREGIQVGTAIATMVRKLAHAPPARVRYRDFWGKTKLKDLEAFGEQWSPEAYRAVEPVRELGQPFREMATNVTFVKWPTIEELLPKSFPGIFTARDQFLVDVDRERLIERVKAYFDENVDDAKMLQIAPQSMTDANRFRAVPTRTALRKRGMIADNIVPFSYRPYDLRWLYWEPEQKLLNEKRADYFPEVFPGNLWFVATKANRKDFNSPITLTRHATLHIIERGANIFPLLLRPESGAAFAEGNPKALGEHVANLSDEGLTYLNTLGGIGRHPDLFFHTVATLHAPDYANENADALRQDWPRVPLPRDGGRLEQSAALGRQLAVLLDPETPVPTVTQGAIRPELRTIAAIQTLDGRQLDPAKDCAVTARWGIAGKGGICMPSTGRAVSRAYTADEAKALGGFAAQLGDGTFDIYLNGVAYWRNVPAKVWGYTLGGYQVLKKWLSYRETALLGRPLTVDEVEYFTRTCRRIAAIRLLGPELDANYRFVCDDLYPWPSK